MDNQDKNEILEAIKGLITKKEFKEFQEETEEFFVAIKNDLDGVATKDDLKDVKDELKKEITDKFDQILTGQDRVLTVLLNNKTELAANVSAHKRFDKTLVGHDARIKVTENKLGIIQ